MNQKELQHYQDLLLKKKEELLKAVSNAQRSGKDYTTEVGDTVDQALDSYEREFLFNIGNNERRLLNEIETALEKIENKNYGVCASCQKKIEEKRLQALPTATLCSACQAKTETV